MRKGDKMLRQGLQVTIEELEKLVLELTKQKGTKFQINIINKTPECSDTWRIEKNNEINNEVDEEWEAEELDWE